MRAPGSERNRRSASEWRFHSAAGELHNWRYFRRARTDRFGPRASDGFRKLRAAHHGIERDDRSSGWFTRHHKRDSIHAGRSRYADAHDVERSQQLRSGVVEQWRCRSERFGGYRNVAGENSRERDNELGGPKISSPSSRVSAWIIPTNEELVIARQTQRILEM